MRTVEAVIDESGTVRLLEPIAPGAVRRVLVTILDEGPEPVVAEPSLLSEASLSVDWTRSEEDLAWARFQPAR